jgi:SAM-dependent methyltransferase
MPWKIFAAVASGYGAWYGTRPGRRVDRAERALLDWLPAQTPQAKRLLEVGCGTGHFARQSRCIVGLDRSPGMLAALQWCEPRILGVQGDAHRLPFRDQAVDVVLFATSLEFLEDPPGALAEAVRVVRHGLTLLVLNRWSLGGISRRIGPQAHQPLLGQARDHSLVSLCTLLRGAAGSRLETLRWNCNLYPGLPWRLRFPVPFGDVLGVTVPPTSLAPRHDPRPA